MASNAHSTSTGVPSTTEINKVVGSDQNRVHGKQGRPAIHPRTMAGVLIYGTLRRIRSSRLLEEALTIRSDFR